MHLEKNIVYLTLPKINASLRILKITWARFSPVWDSGTYQKAKSLLFRTRCPFTQVIKCTVRAKNGVRLILLQQSEVNEI